MSGRKIIEMRPDEEFSAQQADAHLQILAAVIQNRVVELIEYCGSPKLSENDENDENDDSNLQIV